MSIYIRSALRRCAANALLNGVEKITSHSRSFHSTTHPTHTPIRMLPTAVAYPCFQGIAFQSSYLETQRKISFVTRPLFSNNYALRCEAGVSIPALPNKLMKLVRIEDIVEDHICIFLHIFAQNKIEIDLNAFVDVLKEGLRSSLITSKGIYLTQPKFEYIKA